MSVAPANPVCAACGKDGALRCSGCRITHYCGVDCQGKAWKSHKAKCAATPKWYDDDKYRICQDGVKHEGRLELITWDTPERGLGWGGARKEDAEALRKEFKTVFGGDEEKFYWCWPQAFRWTCCGTDAGMNDSCNHHGSGSKPCTCDFCRMAKSLPDSVYMREEPARHGLKLRRGPDRRSYYYPMIGHGAIASTASRASGLPPGVI
ncbi:hypothetical protein HMN09_00754500 [Mycena chlorophos]|uniref:MYND-type domain-containing protein n=1 Tax=Mycena chlorophos TaxID=658473 RepID=A0A8H6SVR0_MYCCL|nr:hypothetical protein HMN09_00754500 [Mycena chlorophos]